jgi:hypothetical protein
MKTGCELHTTFKASAPWCPVCFQTETDALLEKALETLGKFWHDAEGYELMAHIRAHLARHNDIKSHG